LLLLLLLLLLVPLTLPVLPTQQAPYLFLMQIVSKTMLSACHQSNSRDEVSFPRRDAIDEAVSVDVND
jgi:hypothetical protein